MPLGTAAAASPKSSILSEMDIMGSLLANVDVVNDILAEADSLLDGVDSYTAVTSRPEGKLIVPLEENNSNGTDSEQVKSNCKFVTQVK